MSSNPCRRTPVAYGLVLVCTVAGTATTSAATEFDAKGEQERGDRPNILFIITDQQHAEMMSCAGNPHLQTPAMDSLAEGGIRFANAYVANPVCVPSRISMATGMMPGRLGVFNNGMKAVVPKETDDNSLGKLIKRAGYDTFYGGKVHMSPELSPLKAGYDEYFPDQREELPTACIEFIERKRDRPFFVVASFINPHDICFAYRAFRGESPRGPQSVEHLYQQAAALPLDELPPLPDNYAIPTGEPAAIGIYSSPNSVTPSGTMRKTYDEREWRIYRWIYCRLTEQVDSQIGRILEALERNGLEERTLVLFTSDHGDMDACHRLASKGRFYEQSVKVPLLLKYPRTVDPAQVDHEHLASSGIDVLPTLCDFAGVAVPQSVQGRSLRPIAEGRPVDDWRKYVVTENHTGRMLRTQRFKYCVYNVGENRESLADLSSDPGEMRNLTLLPEYDAELSRHRSYLTEWIDQSGDDAARSFAVPVEAAR